MLLGARAVMATIGRGSLQQFAHRVAVVVLRPPTQNESGRSAIVQNTHGPTDTGRGRVNIE